MGMFKKKIVEAKEDAKLCNTRKELFFNILKEDFSFIVDNGLVSGLFSIPLIIVISTFLLIITSVSEITWDYLTSSTFLFGLFLIPAFAIRYIGRIATFGVTKTRVQNESGFYSTIILDSIKKNLKRGILIGLLEGIGFAISTIGILFFLLKTTNVIARGVGIGICVIVMFIIFMASEYNCSISNFYELNFFEAIKNSISFMFIDLLYSFLYFVILVIVPIVITYFFTQAYYIFIFLNILLFDGLSVLYLTLRSHELFDKYINKEYYPDIYHKGLAKKED